MPRGRLTSLLLACLLLFSSVSITSAQTQADWYMAGANPERTSWVSEEVRGNLGVEWYQAIEPYIPYKIQPVFYNGTAYISTARGLYAFDLDTNVGNGGTRVKWVYATELPLGHSPTIVTLNIGATNKTIAYVGGFDGKIHAIDTTNGQPLTGYIPFVAKAGFETNPLIINDVHTGNTPTIIAGNRDGKLYALNALTGSKIWEFTTAGPILYSAAYKAGRIYFASNDLHAYAVNISTGTQIWKSQKFQYSTGFYSYWPVIYTEKVTGVDYVTFTGATNYRPGDNQKTLNTLDQEFFVPGCLGLAGTPCPRNILWDQTTANNDSYFLDGTTLMNLNGNSNFPGITTYFETYPHRRHVFVLNTNNGVEYTFDSNNNGVMEYAPLTWAGTTYAGSKYPAVINGIDNIFYQNTIYYGQDWISRSDPVGWKFGTHFVSRVSSGTHAFDEPLAYASGGKIMYWALCCDREAGAFDVTMSLSSSNRSWAYYGYNLFNKAPDYHTMYNDGDTSRYEDMDGWHIYSGKNQSKNGVYGKHGNVQSPPIPYQGKIYMLQGNTFIAWKPSPGSPVKLSLAQVVQATISSGATPTKSEITQRLETEIQKMINAGPLRPGYLTSSLLSNFSGNYSDWRTLGDSLDYFHNPAETVYTLLLAYPHLSSTLQNQVKTYLQNYYGPGKTYDLTQIQHVGWNTGAQREASTVPPERNYFRVGNPTSWKTCCAGGYWQFPPFNFYAAWKYAQIIGNNDPTFARNIFDSMSSKIEGPTDNTFLIQKPFFNHQYAAGYYGYLQLKQLAGRGSDATVQSYYDSVIDLRTSNFGKDTPFWPDSVWCGATNNCASYWRATSVMRNFAFLTPEIATVMKQQIPLSSIQEAFAEYSYVAPYWFVGKFDNTVGEGTIHHLYDSPALFQAKAWILDAPYEELVKYLDVPSFAVGDLFYIQNLVAAIQATSDISPTPTPALKPGDVNSDGIVNITDLSTLLSNFGKTGVTRSQGDLNGDGIVNLMDLSLLLANFGK